MILGLVWVPRGAVAQHGFDDGEGAHGAVAKWRISPRPSVTIGGMLDGPEEQMLINVLGATRLSDGSIVLCLYTKNFFEIRYFDSRGEFLTSAGRFGNGPFELALPPMLFQRFPGDSVFVVDQVGRFSIFGPRGERGRSGRLGRGYTPGWMPERVLPGGRLVVSRRRSIGGSPRRGTTTESEITIIAVDPDGEGRSDTLGVFPGDKTVIGERSGLLHRVPFQPLPYTAGSAGRFWYGHSSSRCCSSIPVETEPSTRFRSTRGPGG